VRGSRERKGSTAASLPEFSEQHATEACGESEWWGGVAKAGERVPQGFL
jgi:hypothetical protein